MRRRCVLAAGLSVATLAARPTQAQGRMARIGVLTAQREAGVAPYLGALRAGLADAGLVEGRTLQTEYRYADDDAARVPVLAQELLGLKVSVIMVMGGVGLNQLRAMSLPVPLVYAMSGDPVAAGFAESLSRPRGAMTGMTFMAEEVNGKRFELLRDIVPGLKRIAVVANPEHPGQDRERDFTLDIGRRMGLDIDFFPTRTRAELDSAFAAMTEKRPQGLSVFTDGFAIQNRQHLARFAIAQRMPLISGWAVFAESGALCTFGPRLQGSYQRLGYYVDRILKGAKPADLPIERPSVFELVVNMKTAAAIGVTVPQTLLAQADTLIE